MSIIVNIWTINLHHITEDQIFNYGSIRGKLCGAKDYDRIYIQISYKFKNLSQWVSLAPPHNPLPIFKILTVRKVLNKKLVKLNRTFLLNVIIYYSWINYFSNFYPCDGSCSQQFILSNQSLSRTCRNCSFIKVRTKILQRGPWKFER